MLSIPSCCGPGHSQCLPLQVRKPRFCDRTAKSKRHLGWVAQRGFKPSITEMTLAPTQLIPTILSPSSLFSEPPHLHPTPGLHSCFPVVWQESVIGAGSCEIEQGRAGQGRAWGCDLEELPAGDEGMELHRLPHQWWRGPSHRIYHSLPWPILPVMPRENKPWRRPGLASPTCKQRTWRLAGGAGSPVCPGAACSASLISKNGCKKKT